MGPKQPPSERYKRRHQKDRPADNRFPAQRDRDRILFTSAFRRLAGITQVVGPEEGHIFHNRLTHSLEVAQVGRRLAEKLLRESPTVEEILNPDVVESACMAHDLGHPPFGHVAETLLDELATKADLPDGFEGNAQSFRIVTKLAFRSAELDGLNLTRATLNAVLKYPWQRGISGKKNRKWGAYGSEEDDFKFARELMPIGSDAQSLEAAIMDWSDDITYSVHDLEDFYRARLIPLHILVSDKEERERFFIGAGKRLKRDEHHSDEEIERLIQVFNAFIDSVPLDAPFEGTQLQRSALRSFTAGVIGRYVNGTAINAAGELEIPQGYRSEVKMLKQLTWHYVIENPALATQQFGQKKIISDLFAIFDSEASHFENPHLFPATVREQLEELHQTKSAGTERKRAVRRVVIDLISGMTERHAVEMHRRLNGAALGSVLDYIGR